MAQVAQKPMKTTGKPTGAAKTSVWKTSVVRAESATRESVKKEPIRFVPVSNEELMAAIEASREKNKPVLEYLKDK